MEILSSSDTRRVQRDRFADYVRVHMLECWLINIEAGTVEVLQNTDGT